MTRRPPTFGPATLRNYALIADGERGAVVGPNGDVAFLCAPRWHDPAVFSALIGGRGLYAVTPRADRFVWGGHYESETLVWRNRWVTDTGSVIECRDALALPADPHRLVLLRRIEATKGDAHTVVTFDPRAEFGAAAFERKPSEAGVFEGTSGGLEIRWYGAPGPLHREDGTWYADVDVPAGGHHDLVLEISDAPLPPSLPDPDIAWTATFDGWQRRTGDTVETIAPGDVSHSLAVLHGLTSTSGGMVAAATTSLPERSDAGRNYDYRYAWIRDQCYAGQAAAAAGDRSLLLTCADFVTARLLDSGPELKPAYRVDGDAVPDESRLRLPGYPGGQDVVGNHVNAQFQLDAAGEILLLLARLDDQELDHHHQAAAELAHKIVVDRWQSPDAGVWELEDRQWTHSKLICAAGLRAYARLRPGPVTFDWEALADHIVTQTARSSTHATGRWQRAFDDERVDAALLLPPLRGAVPMVDPRTTATLRAVREELGRDGYVYRFRHDDRPLDEAEGAFLLCGFLMALAEHEQGNPIEAVRWFERNRSAVGPPGLFTEEFDVVQRQLRGNLPQAFVHALLVEAASRLARPPASGVDR